MITGWLEQAYDPGLANPSKMQEHWVIYRRAVISSALNRWYERSNGHMLLGWETGQNRDCPGLNYVVWNRGCAASVSVRESS